MAIGILGSHKINLKFGETVIPFDYEGVDEFVIIQDINMFLPMISIKLKDTMGVFTHMAPFDKGMTRISVGITSGAGSSNNDDSEPDNIFDFIVYKENSESEFSSSNTYGIKGLLDVNGLLAPERCRSWNSSVKSILEGIANNELNVDETKISYSLSDRKKIVQPYWTNAQLIKYLMNNMTGAGDEGGYFSFLCNVNCKTRFVFNTWHEMCLSDTKYKFIVNDEPYQDCYPIYDYTIINNYKILGFAGSKSQSCLYFDYDNDEVVDYDESINDFMSLSDFHMIDNEDEDVKNYMSDTGRSNEFTSDFKGKVKTSYYKRLGNTVKMWALTWGLPNLAPGDIVVVLFAQGMGSGNIYGFQYSGYWMVERVVHTFSNAFRTRMLLTRNGVDTDIDTSLLAASKRKK